jgi:hypothetical protein
MKDLQTNTKHIQDITKQGPTNRHKAHSRHYKTRTYKQTQSTFKTLQNKDLQTNTKHIQDITIQGPTNKHKAHSRHYNLFVVSCFVMS